MNIAEEAISGAARNILSVFVVRLCVLACISTASIGFLWTLLVVPVTLWLLAWFDDVTFKLTHGREFLKEYVTLTHSISQNMEDGNIDETTTHRFTHMSKIFSNTLWVNTIGVCVTIITLLVYYA